MSELPKEIFRHWTRSHEEDKEDIKAYRPSDFDFPLSRGRTGFEIRKNGEFIEYGVGPDDRSLKIVGRWEPEGANKIKVHVREPSRRSYSISILSCSQNMLRVKQQY